MKANKMSKKSTITITVMACLLAVAVATTIVLAAFSANKTASTTITFSNGVQLQINGAYRSDNTAGAVDPISKTTDVALLWACTETGATKNTTSTTVSNVSNIVTFDPIKFTNGDSTVSTTAWLIAKATIAAPSGGTALTTKQEDAIDITVNTTGWVALGTTGWYAYGAAASGTPEATLGSTAVDFTDLAVNGEASFITAASINPANGSNITIDDLAGAVYEAKIQVFAVNAGAADAETVLAAAMTTPVTP